MAFGSQTPRDGPKEHDGAFGEGALRRANPGKSRPVSHPRQPGNLENQGWWSHAYVSPLIMVDACVLWQPWGPSHRGKRALVYRAGLAVVSQGCPQPWFLDSRLDAVRWLTQEAITKGQAGSPVQHSHQPNGKRWWNHEMIPQWALELPPKSPQRRDEGGALLGDPSTKIFRRPLIGSFAQPKLCEMGGRDAATCPQACQLVDWEFARWNAT